jgi:hypothetical protein
MILVLALACHHSSERFADGAALQRTMAVADRNHDGTVAVGELPDPLPDRDGNGTLSVDELRASLDVDPWAVHEDELEGMEGPDVRPNKSLARDVGHARQILVRDVLRFLRRELNAPDRTIPSEELILRAWTTGQLDSVPSKEAMAMFRDAAIANGTPLPTPSTPAR